MLDSTALKCHNELSTSNLIICGIIGFFILLFLIDLFFKKWFYSKIRIGFRLLYKRPILWISLSTILFIIFALKYEQDGKNIFTNSNIISILSIVGIIGTIIGVILTYEQLKIAEDRIDGYEKLYEEIFELLGDKSAKWFQFYGATLIPGHIAYGELSEIDQFQSDIFAMIIRIKDKAKINFIVPSTDLYVESYKPYIDKSYRKKIYDASAIDQKVKEVQHLQKSLIELECHITHINKKEEIGLIDSFYFSNGKTAIYVVPLHYQVARAEVSEKHPTAGDIEPTLIGFKTKNRSIVKSFEQKFQDLQDRLNKQKV